MKRFAIQALVVFALFRGCAYSQTALPASPAIPEEARKHFVMGTALFVEAKYPADFVRVESEFKQAAELAPQWPDPRYNLALTEEAAGDFSAAMADLKQYQQFKLSEADARKAQDKIYVLEAKQQKAIDDANAPAAQFAKLLKTMDGGVWRCVRASFSCSGRQLEEHDVGTSYIAVNGSSMSQFTFTIAVVNNGVMTGELLRDIPFDPTAKPKWTAPLTSRNFNAPYPDGLPKWDDSFAHDVAISDDGRTIAESLTYSYHWGNGSCSPAYLMRTYVRYR